MSDELSTEKRRDAYETLAGLEMEIEEHRGRFLRFCGWTYSSSHPDCRWRWSKSFDGVNYSLSSEQAISLEMDAVR